MSQTLADLERRYKQGAELRQRLKDAGITHAAVAAEAGVGPTLVAHVLAGRAKSRNVLDTIARLLDGAGKSPRRGRLRRDAQAVGAGAR